ncbi:hypothetical protein OAF98_04615, partial [Planctomicrobium sp.]
IGLIALRHYAKACIKNRNEISGFGVEFGDNLPVDTGRATLHPCLDHRVVVGASDVEPYVICAGGTVLPRVVPIDDELREAVTRTKRSAYVIE